MGKIKVTVRAELSVGDDGAAAVVEETTGTRITSTRFIAQEFEHLHEAAWEAVHKGIVDRFGESPQQTPVPAPSKEVDEMGRILRRHFSPFIRIDDIPGTRADLAAELVARIADHIGVDVKMLFNGHDLIAEPGMDGARVYGAWADRRDARQRSGS